MAQGGRGEDVDLQGKSHAKQMVDGCTCPVFNPQPVDKQLHTKPASYTSVQCNVLRQSGAGEKELMNFRFWSAYVIPVVF